MELHRTDLELEVLNRRIRDKEIDLQPEYQRGEIWNNDRRVRLIDSILRGWYIPAIHLLRDPDRIVESVLDGQQRLATIRDFFADEILVSGFTDPFSSKIEGLDGMSYSQLPEIVQVGVRRFPITVVSLSSYEPEEPFELFFRLNQQAVLNPPEKRNALFGEARSQVREMVDGLVASGLLSKSTVGFNNDRLGWDDSISRAALAVEIGDLRVQINNRRVEDFYREAEFSSSSLDRTMRGAERFLEGNSISSAKQNKASFFSWIVALAFMRPKDPEFIARIAFALRNYNRPIGHEILVGDSSFERLPISIEMLVDIFGNRASYRSNDTKSVLLRDFVLHLVGDVSGRCPSEFSDKISQVLRRASHSTQEDELYRLLGDVEWGQLR